MEIWCAGIANRPGPFRLSSFCLSRDGSRGMFTCCQLEVCVCVRWQVCPEQVSTDW